MVDKRLRLYKYPGRAVRQGSCGGKVRKYISATTKIETSDVDPSELNPSKGPAQA